MIKRIPQLTSLRGLAALWVFIYHIPIYLNFGFPLNTPVLSAGYLGVPIFFCLSIFLLLRSLDSNPSLEHYFKRRIKRIWPMYFITIAIVFLYGSHSITWLAEQVSFSGVFLDSKSIEYVFWSLQVEEVAYLFFPLIHRVDSKKALGILLYLVGVASFFLIYEFNLVWSLWWLPLTFASYGIGILAYLRKIPKLILPLILLSFFYWDVIPFEMASVFVVPAFGYLVQEAQSFRFLSSQKLIWVGNNSYALYLIHPLLLSIFGVFGVFLALPLSWGFETCTRRAVDFASRLTAFSIRLGGSRNSSSLSQLEALEPLCRSSPSVSSTAPLSDKTSREDPL